MDDNPVRIQVDVGGIPSAMGRIQVPARDLALHGSVLFAKFHARSSEIGLVMTDAEIGENCWAPMMARVADMTGTSLQERRPAEVQFVERALGFLLTVAFHEVNPGEFFLFDITARGKVSVTRRPPRLLGRNRYSFGNYRRAMAQPAAAFGQVG